MSVRVSSGAYAYRCRNSGKCCDSYRIGVDPEKKKAIAEKVSMLPEYAGKNLFEPGVPGSFLNHAMLAREDRRCLFFRSDKLCDLHARFGEPAKPLVCIQYPYFATGTPRGVSVGIFYSCPSAVRTLREETRFEVLADPPGFHPPVLTKKVPDHYPVWLAPGRPVSWDFHHAAESWIVSALQDAGVPFREALYGIRQVLEKVGEVADLDLSRAAGSRAASETDRRLQKRLVLRFVERRGRIGVSSGERDFAIYKKLLDLLREEGAPGAAWPRIDPAWEGILRRYLCGKTFANLLFVELGIIPAFQSVLVLQALAGWTAQAMGVLEGRAMDTDLLCEAIEYTERLFPHDDETFSLWSRKTADYETTGLEYARILVA